MTYDDEKVPYERLLATFWAEHDPTQVDRQGPDVGKQYRTVIFVDGDDQRAAAEASRAQVQARLSRPVATSIEDAPPFWEAEDYHQQLPREARPRELHRAPRDRVALDRQSSGHPSSMFGSGCPRARDSPPRVCRRAARGTSAA